MAGAADDIVEVLIRKGYEPEEARRIAKEIEDEFGADEGSRVAGWFSRRGENLENFAGRASERATDRMTPDFRQFPEELANQPSRATNSLATNARKGAVGIAKYGGGAAVGIVGVQKGTGLASDYFDRQTQQEISKNRESMFDAINEILADESLSFDERRQLIKEVTGLNNRPAGDEKGDGPFPDISLPFIGDVPLVGLVALLLLLGLVMRVIDQAGARPSDVGAGGQN